MAISTSTNPLFFDTTTNAEVTGPHRIQAVLWTGTEAANRDIAANDDFELTDTAGNSLIEKRASANGDDLFVTFPTGLPAAGITVAKLDGGVCYIYLV